MSKPNKTITIEDFDRNDPRTFGEYCLICKHKLVWEGQKQLRCLNPECAQFGQPLLN